MAIVHGCLSRACLRCTEYAAQSATSICTESRRHLMQSHMQSAETEERRSTTKSRQRLKLDMTAPIARLRHPLPRPSMKEAPRNKQLRSRLSRLSSSSQRFFDASSTPPRPPRLLLPKGTRLPVPHTAIVLSRRRRRSVLSAQARRPSCSMPSLLQVPASTGKPLGTMERSSPSYEAGRRFSQPSSCRRRFIYQGRKVRGKRA